MRVFIDECVDWRLARHLTGHDVRTAHQMGWSGVKNGALLVLVAGKFDAFLTVDRNLSFQNKVANLPFAVIVLHAYTNRLPDLIPLLPECLHRMMLARPGELLQIGTK